MKSTELSGVVVPVITPGDGEDRVDEPAFRQLLRRLIQAGVHGLFTGGSAGEGPLLTSREWQRMAEIAFDEVNGEVPLLGGVMDASTQRVKERIEVLSRIGYEYFVVTPTYYIALKTPEEHLRLFNECADAGRGMHMVAYNIPVFTKSYIPVEVICDLGRRGLIQYCKDSSGNMDYFKRLVTEGARSGVRIFMGEEACMSEGMLCGACGIVPGTANLEPETFIRVYQAGIKPDLAELAEAQKRINELRENIIQAGTTGIAGLKYALSVTGIGSGDPFSPLEPLDAAQKKRVREFVSHFSEIP